MRSSSSTWASTPGKIGIGALIPASRVRALSSCGSETSSTRSAGKGASVTPSRHVSTIPAAGLGALTLGEPAEVLESPNVNPNKADLDWCDNAREIALRYSMCGQTLLCASSRPIPSASDGTASLAFVRVRSGTPASCLKLINLVAHFPERV